MLADGDVVGERMQGSLATRTQTCSWVKGPIVGSISAWVIL